MSDHSWDDHDDHDDHDDQDPDTAGALDYLGDTGSVDDADPDDSGLDQLVTSDDEAHREEPDDADSYAAAMEPPATTAPDDDEAPQDDEPRRVAVFAVTDPAGRVTAEASISGSIQRIKLSPGATAVTEAELTRSILSTAKLANMKGRAIQRSLIEGVLLSEGLDEERVEAIIEANASDLPTPRQADDAVAEAEAAYLRGQH